LSGITSSEAFRWRFPDTYRNLWAAHTLGLIIDRAIVAALATREAAVADTAGRACAAILADTRDGAATGLGLSGGKPQTIAHRISRLTMIYYRDTII
jgi:hypothetical protein